MLQTLKMSVCVHVFGVAGGFLSLIIKYIFGPYGSIPNMSFQCCLTDLINQIFKDTTWSNLYNFTGKCKVNVILHA
jgi:hypothetical protein